MRRPKCKPEARHLQRPLPPERPPSQVRFEQPGTEKGHYPLAIHRGHFRRPDAQGVVRGGRNLPRVGSHRRGTGEWVDGGHVHSGGHWTNSLGDIH